MATATPMSPVSPTTCVHHDQTTPTNNPEHERDTDAPLPYEQYIPATSPNWYNPHTIEQINMDNRTQNHRIVAEFLPRRLAHYEVEYGITKEQMRHLLREEAEKRNGAEGEVGTTEEVAAGNTGGEVEFGDVDRFNLTGRNDITTCASSDQTKKDVELADADTAEASGQDPPPNPLDATPFELCIFAFIIFVIRLPFKVLHLFAHPWESCRRLHVYLNRTITNRSLAFSIGLVLGSLVAAAIGVLVARSLRQELRFCYSLCRMF